MNKAAVIQFPKPPVGNTKSRIKFGIRKNGTKWYYGLPSRRIREAEKDGINLVLRMLYGEMRKMRELGDSSDKQS